MLPIQEEVMGLVRETYETWPFPKGPLPNGASDDLINAFSARVGLPIPDELRAWLRLVNGSIVGPGGSCSLKQMEQEYRWHPEWKTKGWIKVADDGCGDPYILDTSTTVGDTHPVYFIDHETYEGEADYVVASGLWVFLRFLLMDDKESQDAFKRGIEQKRFWPFDAGRVLAEDPALGSYKGNVPLAWETN